MLVNKSITELRGVAQAMGVVWGFGDDKDRLIHLIETKRDVTVPPAPVLDIPLPNNQLLRTLPPARISREQEIMGFMQPYIDRGLRFTISDDLQTWSMQAGIKTDSGTMRQPPRILIECAEKVLK